MSFMSILWENNTKMKLKSQGNLIKLDSEGILKNATNISNFNNVNVISIVGDARKGKSTLLNTMINSLTKNNVQYFKVSSSLEHCTKGIDYVLVENILFIDCQGLNYESSANDAKLLLFIYSLSDIIIYNEKNIVNNNFFTTFQPMATYLSSFGEALAVEKTLLIRVADYDLDDDVGNLGKKLFNLQKDQYDNVRKSINKLFNVKQIKSTEAITKKDKTNIKNNDYNALINNKENDIGNFIEYAFSLLKTRKPHTININNIIESINNNKKIDFNKFDVYTLQLEKEINEYIIDHIFCYDWISNKEIIKPCVIDGMNNTKIILENFIDEITSKYKEFNHVFAKAPNSLKNKHNLFFKQILDNLKIHIDKNIQIGIDISNDEFNNNKNIIVSYYEGMKTVMLDKFNDTTEISFSEAIDSKSVHHMKQQLSTFNEEIYQLYSACKKENNSSVSIW